MVERLFTVGAVLGSTSWHDWWFDWSIDTWPLLMGVLVGLGCGLLGCVFLLRRAALLGDAVSHSVLPGVAAGLLVAGLFHRQAAGELEVFGVSFSFLFVVGGALIAGLAATSLIEALHRYSRIKPDTAIGAVFPAFFAVGVIFIEVAARGAHFDVECVFYGSLENIGHGGQVVPTLVSAILVTIFFLVGTKEILISSFDPDLSDGMGLPTRLVQRLLVALLAMTVVSAFEAVGAILVVAFLIVPPATARLLSDRFQRVLFLSAVLGVSAAVLGSWLTIALSNLGFETARAPTMAIVAGLQFALAFLFAPKAGLWFQHLRHRALTQRIADENLLGSVWRLETQTQGRVAVAQVADALGYDRRTVLAAQARCRARGELEVDADAALHLSEEGRKRIEEVIRAHRLWESWLAHELGAAPDHVHDAADQMEHHLRPDLVRELEAQLEFPDRDPHGTEIPGRSSP